MQWDQRIANYVRETKFPKSLFSSEDGRVVGTWIMGNDYRVKTGYYGGYPAGYLRRVRSLFPEKRRVLHIFSGQVDLEALPGDTVDINADLKPTYVDDAQTLLRVPLEKYDLILADPPYSVEDAGTLSNNHDQAKHSSARVTAVNAGNTHCMARSSSSHVPGKTLLTLKR